MIFPNFIAEIDLYRWTEGVQGRLGGKVFKILQQFTVWVKKPVTQSMG